MPANVVRTPADETLWAEAKREARKQAKDGKLSYALVMHIFQAKKQAKKSETESETERDEKAEPERRRFVVGAKPSPIGKSEEPAQVQVQELMKGEHPDDRRERNARSHNRAARRSYMKTEAGRAANRKAQENYRSSHPERVQAQHEARAEHGESKGSGHKCAVCGKPATHKHHAEGYGDGKGDSIRWLCHEHHVKAHHPKSNLGEKAMNSTSNFTISGATKKKLEQSLGVELLSKSKDPAKLEKHLYDYGNAWYEAYRGTPFFSEAVKLEQQHMLHELERKQKQKQREVARREREKAADKEESVYEWDDKFYAGHDAKVADLKRRHLDWIAESTGEDGLQKPSISKGNPTDDEHGAASMTHAVAVTKSNNNGSSEPGEKKEKSMSEMSEIEVFEEIMKGAILKSADEEAAERMGAVELKRAIAKEETAYAKCITRAANAEALIADLKKGLPPWLKDKKKDGDGDDDKDGDDKDAKDKKKSDKKLDKPPFGKAGMGASKRGGDDEVDEMMDDTAKSLEAIAREGGEPALHKAIEEAFQRASAARDRIRELSKALSTIEHGEAGQAGASRIGASQTSAELGGTQGAGDTSNAEPFGSLGAMNGMPSVDAGQDTKLSEDDRDVGTQMSDGQSALESTMQHGSSGLDSSVAQVMGGDISHGSGMAKSTTGAGATTVGRMGALGGTAQQAMSAANAQHAASLGYGVAPPAPAPTDRSRGREWAQGMVHYSTNEDSRVADLMQKSSSGGGVGQGGSVYGGAMGEPTLDMRAPLLKSMTCGLCKSHVPAMFARCPACGHDHAAGVHGAHMSGQGGGVSGSVLSKSVKESLRAPADQPVVLPNGVLSIPND